MRKGSVKKPKGPKQPQKPEELAISCLWDTDIVIDYLRGHEYAKRLSEHFQALGLIAVSAITHLEVYAGMRPKEEESTKAFLDGLVSIDVDTAVARRAGDLIKGLSLRGITISPADGIIAATAEMLGVPLLTNNVDHYPFPHLQVISGLDYKVGGWKQAKGSISPY